MLLQCTTDISWSVFYLFSNIWSQQEPVSDITIDKLEEASMPHADVSFWLLALTLRMPTSYSSFHTWILLDSAL
jgi:hypothetical protein